MVTTYLCINKVDGLWVNALYILFNVKGRRHKITRNGEEYLIETPEGKQIKLRNFSIDDRIAIVWAYDKLYAWDICENVEDLKEGKQHGD